MSREAGGVLVIVAGLALMIAAINGSLQRAWNDLVTPQAAIDKGQDHFKPWNPQPKPTPGGGGDFSRATPGDLFYLPPGYPGSGVRTATG